MAASSSSSQVVPAQSPQVFINFRGELRNTFVSHLVKALKQAEVNCYIDSDEIRSEDIDTLFKRIQESQIALCIFSSNYVESKWCLDELVKIMDQVENNKLKMIPIFFDVKPEDVGNVKNTVAQKLYQDGRLDRPNMPLWEKALKSAPHKMGLTLENSRNNEAEFIEKIVAAVKEVIAQLVSRQIVLSQEISPVSSGGNNSSERPSFDVVRNQLKEMIDFNKASETQIIGIVGMPGIGKTVLADEIFSKGKDKFVFKENIRGIHRVSEGEKWLENKLLRGQPLNNEAAVFTKKIFLVLDDVSHKNQVDFLLKNREWIKKGSKIIITTRDKSSISALVHHIYVVPGLNDTEASELFKHHAFNNQDSSTAGNFLKLTNKYVDYAAGNPRALEELGKELCGKEEGHWIKRLVTLPHCCNPIILTELRISYNTLTENQKDAFLDIACFFRSEEEDYVKCLLDQQVSAVQDLAEKLLICISGSRIEMHNLLATFGMELGSYEDNMSGERMCDCGKIIETLLTEDVTNTHQEEKKGPKKVRGIFLNTYKEEHGIPIDKDIFVKKFNPLYLRYLKIYDTLCPQKCKVNTPEGLAFPFEEIRYLHWQNFQLAELPADFNPKNLIDLRIPYSEEIQRVWKAVQELPRLKWVDLSFSTKLSDLSALSKAYKLRRLNLEGCTILDKLPGEMKNMRRLVFLNLRGCVELCSLPDKLNLISLKTLILSGCSKFNSFKLISKNLEFLHLDGTAIARLPPTIQDFPKLVLLNLRNCKNLESLPASLYMLKALKEVILSDCSEIKSFPKIKENMENMQILLLDGTSIEEVPKMLLDCGNNSMAICRFYQGVFQRPPRPNGLSMLRRLCLSRNDRISSLESCISQLYHLKWIDLRYCTSLTSLLTLPPNLEYLNAHACISLKTVASPLALLMPTEQVSSSFIFTSCEKLEQVAKNEIICYAHKKSQLLSDALNRQNKGIACETLVATCFPGSVVPAWFNQRASGAVLELELPPYLNDNGFVGIALCAIVSFQDYKIQNNNFKVKCISELKNVETSCSFFNFQIGDLSEPDNDKQHCTVNSTHVFIGFTSWLNINQYCQEVEAEKGCVSTKPSIRFKVTDGTCEATKCKVVKCGFSVVCESDNGSWDASQKGRQSGHVSNADASSTVSESGNGSRDTNVAVSPGREEGKQGVISNIWSFLRERMLRPIT